MPRLLLRLLRFRLDVRVRSVSERIQWFGEELLLRRSAPPAGAPRPLWPAAAGPAKPHRGHELRNDDLAAEAAGLSDQPVAPLQPQGLHDARRA